MSGKLYGVVNCWRFVLGVLVVSHLGLSKTAADRWFRNRPELVSPCKRQRCCARGLGCGTDGVAHCFPYFSHYFLCVFVPRCLLPFLFVLVPCTRYIITACRRLLPDMSSVTYLFVVCCVPAWFGVMMTTRACLRLV